MKKSFAYAAAVTLVMTLAAVIESFGTTFEQYDNMPFKQQSQFIQERAKTIYSWLKINDPAKAECMLEKFTPDPEKGYSQALVDLEKQIKGVPAEDRGSSKIEDLMAYFVIKTLCGDVTSNPPQQNPPDDRAK